MSKTPKKATKAIEILDGILSQLEYFYGGMDHPRFREDALKPILEIEQLLKDLAINKRETHRTIAKRYEKLYEDKLKNRNIPVDASPSDFGSKLPE